MVRSLAEQETSPKRRDRAVGPTQAPPVPFSVITPLRREASNRPHSVEAKNVWSNTSTPLRRDMGVGKNKLNLKTTKMCST
jgi:hypothetical protein